MSDTKIQWATKSWNPITGCSPISAGCDNCYAQRMAVRLAGRCGYDKDNPFRPTFHADKLDEPLKWRKPQRVFVCSMGDLFHDDVFADWGDSVFDVIRSCPQHTFMLLTKRPENMRAYFNHRPKYTNLPNVWLGVTAENQEMADYRIPVLLEIPAAKRFVSVEPMLEDLVLCSGANHRRLDWVICGAESGHGARPMQWNWARNLKNDCRAANVPFFFKQMKVGKKKISMPPLDGRIWDEVPE